jgi:predicted dehydrogenase
MDLGIVMIDLILWLMDFPKVETVSASMFSHKTKHVEDSASCFFRLADSAAVSMQVSWNAPTEKQQYYLDFIGSKGSASVHPLRIHKIIAGSPANVTPVLPESHSSIFRRSYEHELRHFAGAIRGIHPVISTGDEAVARMRLVEAAYKSHASRREVAL